MLQSVRMIKRKIGQLFDHWSFMGILAMGLFVLFLVAEILMSPK